MANTTVFSIKGDIKDLDAKLKAVAAASKQAFGEFGAAATKATEAEARLTAEKTRQDKIVNTLRSSILALRNAQADGAKLSKEEVETLKSLEKQYRNAKKVRTETLATMREEVAEYKRLKTAQKAYLSDVNTVGTELKKLKSVRDKSTSATEKQTSALRKEDAERRALGTTLVRHIRRLESLAVGYFALTRAYQSTYGEGVKLNRQYENMELGLTALLAAKTKAVDAYGNEVDAITKFNAAQALTVDTLDKVKKASLDTPATFMEMTGFYQQAIGHALAAGDAFGTTVDEISDNTITLTKRMSNLGASMGMGMDLINEEIRSLMSGDVSRDSKLALVLFGNPTQANAAIKEAKTQVGGLTKLFDDALKPFAQLEGIMTFDKQFNHLLYQIHELQREASKPIFEDLQAGAAELTAYLKENGHDMAESFKGLYEGLKASLPYLEAVAKAFVAYKSVTLLSAAANAKFVTSLVSLTARVGAAKTAMLLLNRAIKANPLFIAGSVAFGAIEFVSQQMDDMAKATERATKGLKRFDDAVSIKAKLDATRAELANVKKEIESFGTGAFGFVDYAFGTKAEIQRRADMLETRIRLLSGKLRKLADENADVVIGFDEQYTRLIERFEGDEISVELYTAEIEKLNEKVLEAHKIQLRVKDVISESYKEKLKEIEVNQKNYETIVNLTGTDYDKWILKVSNELIALGEAGATPLVQQKHYNASLMEFKETMEKLGPEMDAHVKRYYAMQDAILEITGSDYDKYLAKVAKEVERLRDIGVPEDVIQISKDKSVIEYWGKYADQIDKAAFSAEEFAAIMESIKTLAKNGDDAGVKSIIESLKGFGKDGVKEATQTWADTFESQLTDSVVSALKSGDIESAFAGLAAQLGSAMMQESIAGLVGGSGGALTDATAGLTKIFGGGDVGSGLATGVVGLALSTASSIVDGIFGGPSGPTNAELRAAIDEQTKKEVSKFDSQIKLLTSIDRTGLAAIRTAEKARTEYSGGISSVLTGLREATKKDSGKILRSSQEYTDVYEEIFGAPAGSGKDIDSYKEVTDALFATGDAATEAIIKIMTLLQRIPELADDKKLASLSNEYAALIDSFAASSAALIGELKSTVIDLGDMYDTLTGTEKYSSARMNETKATLSAYVDDLSKAGFAAFLENAISSLSDSGISNKLMDALLSEDVNERASAAAKINEQYVDSLSELDEFVLSNIDSIKEWGAYLSEVDAATAKHVQSLKDLSDRLYDTSYQAQEYADVLGIDLAKAQEMSAEQWQEYVDGLIDGSNDISAATDSVIEATAYFATKASESAELVSDSAEKIESAMLKIGGSLSSIYSETEFGQTQLNNLYATNFVKLLGESGLDTSGYSITGVVSDWLSSDAEQKRTWADTLISQFGNDVGEELASWLVKIRPFSDTSQSYTSASTGQSSFDSLSSKLSDMASLLQDTYASRASIDNAFSSIMGIGEKGFGEYISDMIGKETPDKIITVIQDAYEYEKQLAKDEYDEKMKLLSDQLEWTTQLKDFADQLFLSNKISVRPDANIKRSLDKAISEYVMQISSGGDASSALTDIQGYTGEYVSYLKATSIDSASYNSAVATLAGRLKDIGGNETTLKNVEEAILQTEDTYAEKLTSLEATAGDYLLQLQETVESKLDELIVEMSAMPEVANAIYSFSEGTLTAEDVKGTYLESIPDIVKVLRDYDATKADESQEIATELLKSGLSLPDGWTPSGSASDYSSVLQMYALKEILDNQKTTEGIDYWVGELQTYTVDQVGDMIDSVLASQDEISTTIVDETSGLLQLLQSANSADVLNQTDILDAAMNEVWSQIVSNASELHGDSITNLEIVRDLLSSLLIDADRANVDAINDVLYATKHGSSETVSVINDVSRLLLTLSGDTRLVNNSLSFAAEKIINAITSAAEKNEKTSANETLVRGIYAKLGLSEMQIDESGYEYWVDELRNNSKITFANIEESIARAAEIKHNIDVPYWSFDRTGAVIEAGNNCSKDMLIELKKANEKSEVLNRRIEALHRDNAKMRKLLEREELRQESAV